MTFDTDSPSVMMLLTDRLKRLAGQSAHVMGALHDRNLELELALSGERLRNSELHLENLNLKAAILCGQNPTSERDTERYRATKASILAEYMVSRREPS